VRAACCFTRLLYDTSRPLFDLATSSERFF